MYANYFSGYNLIGIILVMIATALMIYAQNKVQKNYTKYSKVASSKGLTGENVAREILDSNGLNDVSVNMVKGHLSDHYDPRKRTVNLSEGIYSGTSIASLAIAAHECGHAIQHKEHYKPMEIRGMILPFCNVSNYLGWVAVFIGLIAGNTNLAWIGVILMLGILVFQLVTLPVEFDASSRALTILNNQYLTSSEYDGAKSMLSSAALTYVASMFATMMSLLRIVLMILGSQRD